MRLLPDTNVLIYDTVEDSEHHDEAAKVVDEAREIVIPSIVVHEYLWAMLKIVQAAPSFVALKVREYLEDPRTTYILEPMDAITEALRMLEADRESVKEVNDYVILATALHYDLTLATFDGRLKKRALRRGLRTVP